MVGAYKLNNNFNKQRARKINKNKVENENETFAKY